MHQLGLMDLTAGLTGTPSHYPHQAGTHPSRIDTCYGDPTTVRVHEAAYGDLPPKGTGHRPLYINLIIPNLPPPAATLPDDTLPPTLHFPAEDDHGAWHRYNRALHAILRRPDASTLNTAMRRAAQACGMERDTSHTGAPTDLTLQQLIHDIWTTKEELATLLRPSTPEARDRDAHLCALLTSRRHQLQEWHAHRIAAAAQERERYGRNDTPYKSLRYVSRILEDTGRRTIHAVRTPEGGLTNDPDAVLQAVLDGFQAQHGDALPELDPHTRNTIREHVPRVFNRKQRRAIEHDPFSISELQRALDRLRKGDVPSVDGLPAEAYQRLRLPVKRRLAARLWDIVTGATPIPPEWANLVHPLYKKGDWAQPGNWRPIVCATTEVKLVWTLILGRIAPAVFAHVPASMWGAMAGRSPHEAIFLQDTALDINPYEMIIASLDVQGALPHAPHRLHTEVWDAMGLPFLSFMTGYIQTRLYAVITAAGLIPWTGTDSGVPRGGAEGPFLYLLVTLPLAFELARVYPGSAPYPLRSPLINFADDNLLTTATRHRDPQNAGLPTHHNLPGRQPAPSAPPQIGRAGRRQDPHPPQLERRTPTPGRHHSPPGSHNGHAAPPHHTPKQAGRAPRPATPNCQGGPPVYAGPGVLHGSGAQRSHQVPSPAPPAPPRRPTPRSTASDEGMGATRRLAHVFPQGGHDGPLALLRRQNRCPGQHGLCQTRSAPPTQSDTQPPT